MKNKKQWLVIGMSAIFTLVTVVGLSVAWFAPVADTQRNQNPIEGVVQDKYYESGDGLTPETAFLITKPRHLYNLAWLQYLGFYNKSSGVDNHQFYFKLGDNIDMSKYGAIPPIGTELNPFVGNFDGAGYVVSGVTVSNDFSEYTSHPSAIGGWDNNTKKQPHILGLFGIVGEYPGGNEPTNYSSAINEFKNTGLTGVTIKTVVNDSLLGIAAGYASGTLANIVVDASTLNVAKGAQGNTTAYSTYQNISDYTLVGYTTHTKQVNKVDETIYSVNSSSGYEFNGAEQGTTTGWGGSIDMMSVTQRLQSIRDNLATSTQFVYNKRVNDYYDPEKADTETAVRTDTDGLTYLKNDNDEIGHFNFIGSTSQTILDRYALMGGGHWETHYNYAPVTHTGYKITNGNGHYLKAATFTTGNTNSNNAGTIADCDDSANDPTTVWSVPTNGNSGYISTSYYYNYADNATTYYLYWTGSALRLSTSTNNRTSFTREEHDGKVRFKYNDLYLDYNGSAWTLVSIPTLLEEPELPVQNPVEPEQPAYNSYLANSYQIYYNDGENDNFLSVASTSDTSSQTSLSPSATYGWKFMNRSTSADVAIDTVGNNVNMYVYTTISGTTYYLKDGSSSPYRYTLVSNKNNACYFTKTSGSNDTYVLKSSSSGNTSYYLCYDSSNHAFEDRSAQTNIYSSLTIKTTASILLAQYQAAYQEYLDQIDYRDNVYPGLKDDYDNSVTAYNASFKLTVTYATVYGPDESVDNTTTGTGMNYDDDDVTYFPLSTMNDSNQDYRPADNNTAYVVGGSAITANTTTFDDELTNVRFGYYPISGNIDSDYDSTDGEFDHVYTINNNLAQVEITNDYTNYSKLKTCKESLGGIMKNQTNVYGLHFMEATISMDAITTADYVKVNRETYQNYELPVNSIDFHLKELGYICFMAGSYYQLKSNNTITKRNNSFFSLYQIERLESAPTKINRILEVLEVYKHTSGNENYSYVYKLTDGNTNFYTRPYKVVDAIGTKEWLTGSDDYAPNQYVNSLPSNYTLEFNCASIKASSLNSNTFDKHAYFFQIPMNDGEFCLGSVSGAVGSYLMYLDIGANASKFQRSIFYEHFTSEAKNFMFPVGVALQTLPTSFASKTPVVPLNTVSTIDDSDSVCVKVTAGYKDDITLDRASGDVEVTRTTNTQNAPPIYQGENVTLLHDKNSQTALTVTPISSSINEYKRMTYVDVNVNLAAATVTIITDVNINNAGYLAANRTIEQRVYAGKDISVAPSATYKYDAAAGIDQRSLMRVYNTTTGIRYSDANLLSLSALPIDNVNISSSAILTFRLLATGTSGYTELITLNAVIDNNNQNGSYYLYNGYSITLTPSAGGSITVIVKALNSDKTIYIGNTQVTAVNQVITITL